MRLITPPPTVSERAADEIRLAILNGTLAPGSRVRQEELAEQLGISREPIRKALTLLEQEGLVTTTATRATRVAPLDPLFIMHIYDFRGAVEPFVAGTVAEAGSLDEGAVRGILAAGSRAQRKGNSAQLVELDLAFHRELYRASGNPVVMEVMRAQWSHISRAMLMTMTVGVAAYRKQVWEEHEAIINAILARDIEGARRLSREHIRGAQGLLRARLEKVTNRDGGRNGG